MNKLSTHKDIVPTLMHDALGCSNKISDFSTGMNIFKLSNKPRLLTFDSWTHKVLRIGNLIIDFNGYNVITYNDKLEEIKHQKISPVYIKQSLLESSRFLK